MTDGQRVQPVTDVGGGPAGVLEGTGPGDRGEALAVVRGQLVVGRDTTCDLVLPSDRVSRRHARVWRTSGGFAVEDLGSSNGTFVNGRRVVGAQPLRDGDQLRLGDVDLGFRWAGQQIPPVAPRPSPAAENVSPQGSTAPLPPQAAAPSGAPARDTGQGKALALAVLSSVVGTAFSQALGTGRYGAYLLAVVSPLAAAAFTLRADGRVRVGAVTVVTLAAFTLTFSGVTAAEVATGKQLVTGSGGGGTFVDPAAVRSALDDVRGAPPLVMPDVVGYDNVSAIQLLARAGFDAGNVLMLRAPSSGADFGKVLRTTPAAGAKVPPDGLVRVYLGTGPGPGSGPDAGAPPPPAQGPARTPGPDPGSSARMLVMPDVVGEGNVSAAQLMQRAGFDMTNVLFERVPAPTADFGTVLRTDPVAGSQVAPTAVVRLFLGTSSL